MDRNRLAIDDQCYHKVASREGGVDRNIGGIISGIGGIVASREGGVDRNSRVVDVVASGGGVASREGGVDRNHGAAKRCGRNEVSPPARGAWIATSSSPRAPRC